jgi:hypothetical protein
MISELCSDHFPGRLCQTRGLNKDPIVWLERARPPSNYQLSSCIISTSSKICQTLSKLNVVSDAKQI